MNKLDDKLLLELERLLSSTKEDWLADLNKLKIKQALKIECEDVILEKENILQRGFLFPCFYLAERSSINKSDFREFSINNFYRLEDFSLISVRDQENLRGKLPEFKSVEDFIDSIDFKEICRRYLEKRIAGLNEDLKSS